MSIYEITSIAIAFLALVVSGIALGMDICTRKKVNELHDLEIEKLKAEKERQSRAIIYGYIEDDYFIIENSGDAPASNIRFEGWSEGTTNDTSYLPPHHTDSIRLYITMDSPAYNKFKITWDDESGKDHVWSETLKVNG